MGGHRVSDTFHQAGVDDRRVSFGDSTSDGSILQPAGGSQGIELTCQYNADALNTLNHAMVDSAGDTVATFHQLTAVGGWGHV